MPAAKGIGSLLQPFIRGSTRPYLAIPLLLCQTKPFCDSRITDIFDVCDTQGLRKACFVVFLKKASPQRKKKKPKQRNFMH